MLGEIAKMWNGCRNFASFYKAEFSKMSPKKAYAIIYYLQEHLPVFADHIESCDNCGDCEYLVPANYDRGVR